MDYPYKIREARYNQCLNIARQIEERTNGDCKKMTYSFIASKYNYPTVQDMASNNMGRHIRKYFPFLLYYKEVFQNDSEEFLKTKEYISDLFDEWLIIIPDDCFNGLERRHASFWESCDFDKKVELFKNYISYFYDEEFNDFINCMDYYPFMKYYDCSYKEYKKGLRPQKMVDDLKKIWDVVQAQIN